MAAEPDDARIQVRLAVRADASAIAAVLREAFAEFEPLYTSQAFAATTPHAEQVEARVSEGRVWVALLDGVLVGTVAAVPRSGGLYVRGMAVLPEARGRRIGERLLACVEDYAGEQGCTRLFLSTTPFLLRAIRLYERWGFRRTDDGPHDLFGTPLFTMVKDRAGA